MTLKEKDFHWHVEQALKKFNPEKAYEALKILEPSDYPATIGALKGQLETLAKEAERRFDDSYDRDGEAAVSMLLRGSYGIAMTVVPLIDGAWDIAFTLGCTHFDLR